MEIEHYLKKQVSYQKDTWSSFSKDITINEVIEDIKSGKYKFRIERLRKFLIDGDLESFKAEKLKLPAVTFCGVFGEARKKEHLKIYNHLIVIDIDKLDENKLNKCITDLSLDKYVFSFWISPSNMGIKGLVSLQYNYDYIHKIDFSHKIAFYKLSKYFAESYDIHLDKSGNDTTRLCFLSYDEKLILKQQIFNFEIEEVDLNTISQFADYQESAVKVKKAIKSDAFHNPTGKNKNFERRDIRLYINYLKKKKISIASEYENRYKIAYAISNSFTYDIGYKYFLDICKINYPKYNEDKCIILLKYCYENNTGWTKFNYIAELVKNNGFIKP